MTDEPKPLTDEDLDEIEATARKTLGDPRLDTLVEEPTVLRLVAEVRRLRVARANTVGPWIAADRPPNHNGPVWAYMPAVGNDDDGYGYVMVAHWVSPHTDLSRVRGGWVDTHGRWLEGEERVTHWRILMEPDPPFPPTAEPPR